MEKKKASSSDDAMSTTQNFSHGDEVEVISGDESRPLWIEAHIVCFIPELSSYFVDHDPVPVGESPADADAPPHRQKVVKSALVRPRPAAGDPRFFYSYQPVEVCRQISLLPPPPNRPPPLPSRGGRWCLGIISRRISGRSFVVCFPISQEERQISTAAIRPRLDWVGGKWIKPKMQRATEELYVVGNGVEVADIDAQESHVAWFSASIVEQVWNDIFFVRFPRLNDDGDEQGVYRGPKVVHRCHIRPRPPLSEIENFAVLDDVEAFYNNGWHAGVVSDIVVEGLYNVKSKFWSEQDDDTLFTHSRLRYRKEWINGQWVQPSKE